jgi:hypothetical protein
MTAPVVFFSLFGPAALTSLLPRDKCKHRASMRAAIPPDSLIILSLRYFSLRAIPDVHITIARPAGRIPLPYPADNGQIMGKVPG